MGRRKISMGLIPNRRLRISTFGKRKEGLKKKANELSVLCGVEVALVVAPADGEGGAGAAKADVWESKEGVLARYRELDPEVRARHTFREYLYAELGKEEAKLARVRQAGPDGLDCWDKALDGVNTVEEAQKLLNAIDAAIQAADDRRRALGVPVDDDEDGDAGIVLEGIAPLNSAHVDDGYLLHALGGNGDANDQAMAMWGNNGFHSCSAANMQYGFQQFNSSNVAMEGYDLQMVPDMYNNGGLATDAYHYQTCHAGTMQHGYVFPCARGSASYIGMPSGYQMQQVVGSGAAQPNLAMSSADEPCHAMVPLPVLEYPSADPSLNYMDTQATHGVHGGSGGTSFAMDARGNFINAPPAFSVAKSTGGGGGNFISAPPAAPSHAMGGTSDNITPAQPLAMSYGGDMAIAGRYATQSGMEQLHYLGDLEDTQPNLWGN
ncbi:unnamed protein product [Miscanthus lutarioriparius]|uniref:MADS-box domain-containing protein n=1 Tax=Miscanthus lutarioriparius TaxID=422564 RepID=A0A811P6T5_9POAL|nr:unnamed protein product [Miscanthus lutarioriparius]